MSYARLRLPTIATTAAELLQRTPRIPTVRMPPLPPFDIRLSCSSRNLSTSGGAIGRSVLTISSMKLVSGKKLASARTNNTAGNRARKK
jgi:hypothetical protein